MIIAGSSLLYSRLSFPRACQNLSELGFTAVDIAVIEGWAHFDPSAVGNHIEATANEITNACEDAGVQPVAFNAGTDTDTVGMEIEQIRSLAALAEEIGIEVITLQGGRSEDDIETDFDRFRHLVEAIDSFDVTLTVETHWGTHLEDPSIAAKYPENVPGLYLTIDPGHFAIGPHWDDGYGMLLEDVAHVHLRQAGDGWENVQVSPNDGKIDFEELLTGLEKTGYEDVVSVEYIDSLDGVDAEDAEVWATRMREVIEATLD